MKSSVALLGLSFLFAVMMAPAQEIPAAGLCNTGLTPASSITGCTASTPVTPINPSGGGPSVDGNWQLAAPYPSASFNNQAPNPCSLSTFGPAWVDTPNYSWLNPHDGVSQWITPLAVLPSVGGWFIYRTTTPAPAFSSGSGKYRLTVKGRLLADDSVAAIFIENPADDISGCKAVVIPSPTPQSAAVPESVFNIWNPFAFSTVVTASTDINVYMVLFNVGNPNDSENNTGLRVEFTSAYFTPE